MADRSGQQKRFSKFAYWPVKLDARGRKRGTMTAVNATRRLHKNP